MILSGAIRDESTPNGKTWKESAAPILEISKKKFYKICEDTFQNIWAAGEDGIYCYNKDTGQWKRVKSSPEKKFKLIDVYTSGIAVTEDNEIYCCTSANERLENSSWTKSISLRTDTEIPRIYQSSKFYAFYSIKDDAVYVSTNYGVTWTKTETLSNIEGLYADYKKLCLATKSAIYYYDTNKEIFTLAMQVDESYHCTIDPLTGYVLSYPANFNNTNTITIYSSDSSGKTWTSKAFTTIEAPKYTFFNIYGKYIFDLDGQIFYSYYDGVFTKLSVSFPTVNDDTLILTGSYNDTYVIRNSTSKGQINFGLLSGNNYVEITRPSGYIVYDAFKGWFATNYGVIKSSSYDKLPKIDTLFSSNFIYGNKWITNNYYSIDGKKWQQNSLVLDDIYYLGGIYFANPAHQASGGSSLYSLDGINWKTMRNFSYIAYDGSGTWVLSGSRGYYWSNDGITWTKESTGFTTNSSVIGKVAYGGGIWIGEDCGKYAYYSTDGIEWKKSNLSLRNDRGMSLSFNYYYSENLDIWLMWDAFDKWWGYSYDGMAWTIYSALSYIKKIIDENKLVIILNNTDVYYFAPNNGSTYTVTYINNTKDFYYNDGVWISLKIESNSKLTIETYSSPNNTVHDTSFSIPYTETILLSNFTVEYFKGIWLIQDKVNLKNYYSKDNGATWKETEKGPNFVISQAINNNGIIVARDLNNQIYYSESLI